MSLLSVDLLKEYNHKNDDLTQWYLAMKDKALLLPDFSNLQPSTDAVDDVAIEAMIEAIDIDEEVSALYELYDIDELKGD